MAYAREILHRFAVKAWRRPVDDKEILRYVSLVEKGLATNEPFELAVKLALQAILCAPDFLYIVEVGESAQGAPPARLSDYELATRLSYFLWSSMPDAELFQLAAEKKLRDPKVLDTQVERMLGDAKSGAFIDGFATQWLALNRIGQFQPDPTLYPNYDDTLQRAMVGETRAFFREILDKNLDAANFLNSNWTMLNERIARHYGIPGIKGDTWRHSALPLELKRGGVVTQASILTLTSDGVRSRPVHRGVWILDSLLASPPPPPPPNAGQLPDIPGFSKLSLRDQIEKHRGVESCAACHAKIDPLGFALENFDAIGAWRAVEKREVTVPADPLLKGGKAEKHTIELPIRADSNWADGRTIDGIAGLSTFLVSKEPQFQKALLQKLFIYGTGRAPGYSDIEELEKLRSPRIGLRDLVKRVVASAAFQRK